MGNERGILDQPSRKASPYAKATEGQVGQARQDQPAFVHGREARRDYGLARQDLPAFAKGYGLARQDLQDGTSFAQRIA